MASIERAAEAIARTQHELDSNSKTMTTDAEWILIWETVFTDSVRAKYLAMAAVAFAYFGDEDA